ncbi:DUF4254 domain-containing protein [Nocardia sp. R6R-6]|uniref:DUF4254 domain-containing protein n=1 Tax=Nocardia sp. R6R-6 TaxID=3459303 RepID=UPI00403D89E9
MSDDMKQTALPSKDMVLQACSGTVAVPHPILQAAYELASLHEARSSADASDEIDCAQARLVRDIDCWVAAEKPPEFGAAYRHTETVGMVIDRIAEFSVAAHCALAEGTSEFQRHYAWRRLAELALAYSDLSFEISAGIRRLPDFTYPADSSDETGAMR